MIINSASFTGKNNDVVLAQTDQGEVTIPLPPQKEIIEGSQAVFAEWMANGAGVVTGWVPQNVDPISPIALGQLFVVESGFGADEKVTLFDELFEAEKTGTLESKPKLVAVYTWMKTVKEMAKNGLTEFPPAPFTFEQVVHE